MKGPRPLTAAQVKSKERVERIRALRAEGHSFEDIGREFGIQGDTCESYYRRGVKKYGIEPLPADRGGDRQSIAVKDPQLAGALIAQAAVDGIDDEKFTDLRVAMKAAGMTPKMISGFLRRLKCSLEPVVTEARRITVEEMTKELEKKISSALGYVDDFTMAQASLKDLSVFLNIAIEKHQLLSNKPTHIIDFHSRQQIGALMPAMIAEARRRGITVDGTATRVDEPR